MSSDIIIPNPEVYNYDYFQQDDVCRLCWNRNAHTQITAPIENSLNPIKNDLIDKIRDCLDIVLSPVHPNKACEECCSQINKFYNFKKFCQEAERKLLEILNNHQTTKVEVKIKVEEIQEDYVEDLISEDVSDSEPKNKSKWKCYYKHKRTPTYCNICMVECDTIEKFKNHNFLNHGIENGLYNCFGCEKKFKTQKSRFCHEKNYCKGLKDGYKCSICDRFLPKRGIFESHMRDHRKNVPIELPEELFQCQKCNKLFKTREDLINHVETEHEIVKKNYVCESCGKVFTRRDYLHKHMLTHTGDKQHVCPHCGFRTVQRSSLIVHIRKHTGERPYTCSICPQRCVSSSNLRAHIQRHLGLKMHECTICNKKFGYKVSLREHMTSHAPAQHACPHCGASYTRLRALRRHLSGKHGEKET